MNDTSDWFQGFEARDFDLAGTRIHARIGGRADAPPLLLVHGFPQTHVMWQRVAQQLAPHFRLVLPDLRGYGDSAQPVGEAEHANYSKRVMALDLLRLMQTLGHERFAVCGHDRGGRVAHRLALDHPQAVARLAVIDIAPTLDMYAATDMRFARAYYHWFFLIQPTPWPERMIGANPLEYLHWKLGGWGAGNHSTSNPRRWPNTNAALRAPRPSMRPARTTAPAPASTWNTIAHRARPASASPATRWCCGASAAWCTRSSTRWRCGVRNAAGLVLSG
jgi:pimeloyl-ACP methyl ester carboxylesterase